MPFSDWGEIWATKRLGLGSSLRTLDIVVMMEIRLVLEPLICSAF
jgi:hypothetical protein